MTTTNYTIVSTIGLATFEFVLVTLLFVATICYCTVTNLSLPLKLLPLITKFLVVILNDIFKEIKKIKNIKTISKSHGF